MRAVPAETCLVDGPHKERIERGRDEQCEVADCSELPQCCGNWEHFLVDIALDEAVQTTAIAAAPEEAEGDLAQVRAVGEIALLQTEMGRKASAEVRMEERATPVDLDLEELAAHHGTPRADHGRSRAAPPSRTPASSGETNLVPRRHQRTRAGLAPHRRTPQFGRSLTC